MFLRWIAELHLPKFSISSEFDLVDVLPKLGISEVFTIKGDLSGITGNRNVVVSKVSLQTQRCPQLTPSLTAKPDRYSDSPWFAPLS